MYSATVQKEARPTLESIRLEAAQRDWSYGCNGEDGRCWFVHAGTSYFCRAESPCDKCGCLIAEYECDFEVAADDEGTNVDGTMYWCADCQTEREPGIDASWNTHCTRDELRAAIAESMFRAPLVPCGSEGCDCCQYGDSVIADLQRQIGEQNQRLIAARALEKAASEAATYWRNLYEVRATRPAQAPENTNTEVGTPRAPRCACKPDDLCAECTPF